VGYYPQNSHAIQCALSAAYLLDFFLTAGFFSEFLVLTSER
jgi:hypothetical protein